MTQNFACLGALLLVVTGVASASSITIYDTYYGTTTHTGDLIEAPSADVYASEFETPAGPLPIYLSDVEIYTASGSSHLITEELLLYSNTSSGNAPDTLLGTIGSVSNITDTPTLETFTPASPIDLTADTQYWIVAEVTSPASGYHAIWYGNGNDDSTEPSGGVANEYHGTGTLSSGVWTTGSIVKNGTSTASVPEMIVQTTTTPEPVSSSLLGGGLLALVFFARKRCQARAV